MEDIVQDPYRPIVAIHVDAERVAITFLSGARLLWFGVLQVKTAEASSDWSELDRCCGFLFPKVERIVIDNRPFAFLMNLFSKFPEHQWKYVFITNNILRYKFLRRLDDNSVIGYAEDWMAGSETIPEIRAKLQKHSHRSEIAQALLGYMSFVCSNKHNLSNYHPTADDFK